MLSPDTIRKWFPTTVEETPAEWLERRLRLRRNHRLAEQELHGRGR